MANEQPTVPNEAVGVSYELTYREAITFWRWQVRRLYRLGLYLISGMVVVVSGIVLLAVPRAPIGLSILFLIFGASQLLMFAWIYYAVPVRAWKKSQGDRSPISLTFNSDGVEVHTKNTDAQNRWPVYSEVVERPDAYLLRVGKRRAYTIVPKRAFRTQIDEQRFRTLVGSHISASS